MKKIQSAILLMCLFVLVSCIDEYTGDCPTNDNLIFTHYCIYNADNDYDKWIGADVTMVKYQNNAPIDKQLIPHSLIRDEKLYAVQKAQDNAKVNIVAWALADGAIGYIPQVGKAEFDREMIDAKKRNDGKFNSFQTGLYMGTVAYLNNPKSCNTYNVRMINCAYLIKLDVRDAAGYMSDTPDNYVIVEGTMSSMNMLYEGIGEAAATPVNLTANSENSYTTNLFGVLPSSKDQFLNLTLYNGNKPLAVISTNKKAVSGGRMDVNIEMGISVDIKFYGAEWDSYWINVQWM